MKFPDSLVTSSIWQTLKHEAVAEDMLIRCQVFLKQFKFQMNTFLINQGNSLEKVETFVNIKLHIIFHQWWNLRF